MMSFAAMIAAIASSFDKHYPIDWALTTAILRIHDPPNLAIAQIVSNEAQSASPWRRAIGVRRCIGCQRSA
jgi:hypothetical protein